MSNHGTAQILLRATREDDLDFILNAEQSAENRPFVTMWSRDQHREAASSEDQRSLIIETVADGRRAGYILLAGLASEHQSIEFRRIVVTEKDKGYGREAFRLVKEIAFYQLQAHRLWLDVKEHNARARHVYQSEGFIVEGVLRDTVKTNDGYESIVIMSMLRDEYLTRREQ